MGLVADVHNLGGEVLAFLTLAYLWYLSAINRAYAWGATLKSAFDLYRWELLKQLGYTTPPATMNEERVLWDLISNQMVFGDAPNIRPPQYDLARTAVRSRSPIAALGVTRSICYIDNMNILTILHVKNKTEERVKGVSIVDTVSQGYYYLWDSVFRLEKQGGAFIKKKIVVEGVNPYYFDIGDLEAQGEASIFYVAVPYSAKDV